MATLMLALTACAPGLDIDSLTTSPYADMADTGIAMSIKEQEITTKTESLTIEYANASDIEYVFGKEPHLEIDSESAWYVVPVKESAAWEDIGFILSANGTSEEKFSLGFFYEGLIPGHYRIIKTLYADGNSVTAAVEFDIQ
jgi:hypothetical protein